LNGFWDRFGDQARWLSGVVGGRGCFAPLVLVVKLWGCWALELRLWSRRLRIWFLL